MAFKLAEAFVDVFARTARLTSGFDEVEKKTNRLIGGMSKLSGTITATIGGLALVSFFDKVTTAAMESETSIAAVKATLRSTGQEVNDNTKKIDDMANALRDQANFSDEAARAAATHAMKLGASADQAIELTKAGAGLADLFGGNLQSATNAVVRAQQGNWMSLQRMIPALRNYRSVEEKMAFLIHKSNEGMAARHDIMDTTAGKLQQLKLQWSELEEAIGDEFLPIVKTTLDYVTLLVKALRPGTVESNSLLLGFRKDIYESQVAVLEFIKDHRVLTSILTGGVTAAFDNKYINKEVKELRDNIAYVLDLEKKSNAVATDANKDKIGQINAINAGLRNQQRILSGMPAYWKKVQEALFDPNIAFGAGRRNNAGGGGGGGGRIVKAPPSGLMPTRMGPMGMPSYGTPFRTQPGYMGSGGIPGAAAGVGSMGMPMMPGFVPGAGRGRVSSKYVSEAHRRWAERWTSHKGAGSSSDPTQVGGVRVSQSVAHDRDWHRKNVERLRDRIAWRSRELGLGNMDKQRVYQQSILDRDRQEMQRSSDIVEHGSTVKAGFERWRQRDRQATQARVNRVRSHLLGKANTEEEIQDAMKTAAENAAYEQKKMEARQKAFWDKSHKTKDEEERKRMGLPTDREAQSVRRGLQQRFGVTGPVGTGPLTGPLKVQDVAIPALTTAIDKLAGAVKDLNLGTFGEGEDE